MDWRTRFSQSGWALLPLRIFLGFTMLYAGLLKLTDPSYLDPAAATSVQAQMRLAVAKSPIGGIVQHTIEHASLFGIAIAIGELAVGLSLLLGIWVRLGAVGGLLLSLSFWLTVSWATTPYFFGSDIVFMFAFVPFILAGDGGVWSLATSIRQAVVRQAGLADRPAAEVSPALAGQVERRAMLRTGAVAVGAGVIALAVGAVGRAFGGSSSETASGGSTPTPPRTPSASASPTTAPTASPTGAPPPNGTKVASASQVAVGTAFAYDAPDGSPAYILQPSKGKFLSFSRVCTHEGCSVDFTGSEFACPCHGATFSDTTGDPTGGPARGPLTKYQVVELGGSLYVV